MTCGFLAFTWRCSAGWLAHWPIAIRGITGVPSASYSTRSRPIWSRLLTWRRVNSSRRAASTEACILLPVPRQAYDKTKSQLADNGLSRRNSTRISEWHNPAAALPWSGRQVGPSWGRFSSESERCAPLRRADFGLCRGSQPDMCVPAERELALLILIRAYRICPSRS